MIEEKFSILDNKVHVYKRENSRYWQCSTYMNGRNHRVSTQEDNLRLAKEKTLRQNFCRGRYKVYRRIRA